MLAESGWRIYAGLDRFGQICRERWKSRRIIGLNEKAEGGRPETVGGRLEAGAQERAINGSKMVAEKLLQRLNRLEAAMETLVVLAESRIPAPRAREDQEDAEEPADEAEVNVLQPPGYLSTLWHEYDAVFFRNPMSGNREPGQTISSGGAGV